MKRSTCVLYMSLSLIIVGLIYLFVGFFRWESLQKQQLILIFLLSSIHGYIGSWAFGLFMSLRFRPPPDSSI